MDRKQFTFYSSYYEAISMLETKEEQADAYDVLAKYALTGELPDVSSLPVSVQIIFKLIRPTLDTGRQKAVGGARKKVSDKIDERSDEDDDKIETRCGEDTDKMPQRCKQGPAKEKEGEGEVDIEGESPHPPTPLQGAERSAEKEFQQFFFAYPRKTQAMKAQKVYASLLASGDLPPLASLLASLEDQKRSEQWTKENGRFVPAPTRWLEEHKWLEKLPPSTTGPVTPGSLAKDAVRRMMAEGGGGGAAKAVSSRA